MDGPSFIHIDCLIVKAIQYSSVDKVTIGLTHPRYSLEASDASRYIGVLREGHSRSLDWIKS